MNLSDYKAYCETPKDNMIHAKDFLEEGEGTLLYGYNSALNDSGNTTFHVYLAGGEIHCLEFDYDHNPVNYIKGDSLPADALKPWKRAYPERTRLSFANKMKTADQDISFTTFNEDIETEGKTWFCLPYEELRTTPKELQEYDKVRDYLGRVIEDMHFINAALDRMEYNYEQVKITAGYEEEFRSAVHRDLEAIRKITMCIKGNSEDNFSDAMRASIPLFQRIQLAVERAESNSWMLDGFGPSFDRLEKLSENMKRFNGLTKQINSDEALKNWSRK